jgi:hypothetical protein
MSLTIHSTCAAAGGGGLAAAWAQGSSGDITSSCIAGHQSQKKVSLPHWVVRMSTSRA